jgi:hypothetical protein
LTIRKKPQPASIRPAADPALRRFYEDAALCMEITGRFMLSLSELRAWHAQGQPTKPAEHLYYDGVCVRCCAGEDYYYEDAWCPIASKRHATA